VKLKLNRGLECKLKIVAVPKILLTVMAKNNLTIDTQMNKALMKKRKR
jgi:hypothetical protein